MGSIRLRSSISLSIIIHGICIALWAMGFNFADKRTTTTRPNPLTWIEVIPAKKIHKIKIDDHSQRIVQTESGTKTDTPDPEAFLGEQTQTVDRQTVSKSKLTQTGNKPQPNINPRLEKTRPVPIDPGGKTSTLSKFGVSIPEPLGQHAKKESIGDSSDLALSGPLSDYVKGFKESETTALNTREYVFYGYFQRIRKRLDWAWDKSLKSQLSLLYRSGRHLASEMDHTTRILVTLNQSGEVVKVQVLEESGTIDLDAAAVKAFNQAGPFPNPPKGIVDTQGKIQIRWDFVLRT